MESAPSPAGRASLGAACAGGARVRRWRRFRAVLLLGAGLAPPAVAAALGRSPSGVCGRAAAWRRDGLAGLREGDHGGGRPRLGAAGGALLDDLLGQDPQARGHRATGWTVPLLAAELRAAGYGLSERTVRRALHRRGWRWKRPKYVLGRPDPAYEAKKGRSPSGHA
jgi:transposase